MVEFDSDALAERLQLVMRWKKLAAREWARDSGLSENAINTFLSRHRSGKSPALKNQVLYELAVAADVNPLWLMVGKGAPEPPRVSEDPSPWRTVISRMAEAEGVSREVIDELYRLPLPADDSPFHWLTEIARLDDGSEKPPRGKQVLKLISGDPPRG